MRTEYTLLVVDDEPLVREHYLQILDWPSLGVTEVFQASNGYEALKLIDARTPDIMVLDIKMPEMNGIELLECIREKGVDTQIVVSSGYSDFEAARRMLALGKVVDYLLKPISSDLLFETICKCISNIEQAHINRQLLQNLEGVRGKLRRSWIRDRVFGRETQEDELPVDPPVRSAVVAVCRADNPTLLDRRAKALAQEENVLQYCFSGPNAQYVVLFFEGDADVLPQRAEALCAELASEAGTIIGLSRLYTDEEDLGMSYHEALLACDSNLFTGCSLCSFDRLEGGNPDLPQWEKWVDELKALVAARDPAPVEGYLHDLFLVIMHNTINAMQNDGIGEEDAALLKVRVAQLLELVLSGSKGHRNLSSLFGAHNYYEIYSAAKEILLSSIEMDHLDRGNYRTQLVQKVKEYVREHHSQALTLDQVACTVYLNPSYLSRIFSECEGYSFTEYLTRVRMERAKRLLSTTRMRIYEIAEEVGYRNAKYFIKVFREREGTTPAQFRDLHLFDHMEQA